MFEFLKKIFQEKPSGGETYVEITPREVVRKEKKLNLYVFTLERFDNVKDITPKIREKSIVLIDIRPLMEKDKGELKRAIEKIKIVSEAQGCKVIGIAEGFVIAAPEFVEVKRGGARS